MISLPHLREFLRGLPYITGAFSSDNHEYNFQEFSPDPRHWRAFGLGSAVIAKLDEKFFPTWNKNDGDDRPELEIRGTGAGLEAVVDVLEKYMPLMESGEDQKALDDYAEELMVAAKSWYLETRADVSLKY